MKSFKKKTDFCIYPGVEMYLKSEAYKGANTFSPHCMSLSLEVVYCQLDMCLCGFTENSSCCCPGGSNSWKSLFAFGF